MRLDALADGNARRAALDPTRSFIVEAAAGSGKTALLTQRFLVLLARVAMPEEVVAITFTRKAAAEMRARVLAALALAEAPDATSALEGELQARARAVLAHDANCDWRLRENPGRLRILTIDALTGTLVRQLPLQSGLPPGCRLREDSRDLHRHAARRTLLVAEEEDGEWSRAVRALLDDLDNDWRKLEGLLIEMLARRDQWLPFVIGTPDDAELARARARLVGSVLDTLVSGCPPGLRGQLIEMARWIGEASARRDPAAPESALVGFSATADELTEWQCLADLLLTKAGTARRRLAKSLEPGPESDVTAWREAVQALIAALDAEPAWTAAFAAVRALPSVQASAGETQRLARSLTVLRLLLGQWRLLCAETATIDFTEQALAAVAALGTAENPTDLALAFDYRLTHLLVDEFQDTSRAQYVLLERLTAGWTGEDGRTLFLVGDPLQSIYRFRDADVNLFRATLARRRFGNLPLSPLQLSANFRTVPAILEWLNTTLAQVFATADPGLPPFRPFQATQDATPAGGVTLSVATGESLASSIIDLVRAAWQRKPTATIAILVRSRTHLGNLPQQLAAAGIALATNEIDALCEIPAVNDLMALTRALHDLTDRTAWLALLRAPWCGLSLADLKRFAGSTRDELVWSRLHDPAVVAAMVPAEAARAIRVRDILATGLAARGRVSYARLVEAMWHALGGPATVVEAGALRHVHRYLELLDSLEADGEALTGPHLAQKVAEEFAPFPRGTGPAVEIMTIHRAKGLEFDVVIVPELQREVRSESQTLLLGHASTDPDVSWPVFAPLPPAAAGADAADAALYRHLRGTAKAAIAAEGYRLLYVALTRARDALHLFTALPEDERAPSRGSFLAMMWPALATTFQPLPQAAGAPAATSARRPRRRLAAAALPAAPAIASGERSVRATLPFEWASPLARPIGTVTHAFLQAVAEGAVASPLPLRLVRARLRALGLREHEVRLAAREVTAAVETTRASARGRWLFSPAHREARSEYRLTVMRDGRVADVIIDRTFVSADGVRWIVDFKTGGHEGGDRLAFMASEVQRYRPQLEAYARAFAALDAAPIRLGLYYPRLDEWREWPAADPAAR